MGSWPRLESLKIYPVSYSLGSQGLMTSQGHRMSLAEAGNNRGDMAGGGAEGLLVYPFLCLEAVFAKSSYLGTRGNISHFLHRCHSASEKMRTWEVVPETPL